MKSLLLFLTLTLLWIAGPARGLSLVPLNTPQRWKLLEFRVQDVPAATKPFDPDFIALDATFTLPSGKTMIVPGFWYQAYTRAQQNGNETLTPHGTGEWRVRFCPPEAGSYALSVLVTLNGRVTLPPATTTFTVSNSSPSGPQGYVKIAANNLYFATDQGAPLPLVGENVCWYDNGGTYDYDRWFGKMNQAGENYARIWMCPWAFGLECFADSRTNYHLDTAWQLDYVLQLAEAKGIYLLLCLDYHGMFETQPDYWGGNNYWPQNPYNTANGGPCSTQDAFFTNAQAAQIYQKRLRYLIARYGYSTHLLAWEFFNEIDNEYQYLNATDVANWHGSMGQWLHAHDPYGHLVTTSLTGSSDRPEIWSLPQLDFAQYHAYAIPRLTTNLTATAQSFTTRYQKPMLIGEFGVDWRGWNRSTVDPYLRGFRQGIWTGALGGTAGTAMSWWWEDLDGENLYPIYQTLRTILNGSGWGSGSWQPITFQAQDELSSVGAPVPGGQPFTVTLYPDTGWGTMVPGVLALLNAADAAQAGVKLNAFVQGIWHEDLRRPFKIPVLLGRNARLVMHLNSVSDGSVMQVKVDGNVVFSWNIPNKDGGYQVNNEYNQDVPVALPAGKHLIEIYNAGEDWFYLDWVRFENALPAQYAPGWFPAPLAVGMAGAPESLVYVVNPDIDFPTNATTPTIAPLQGSGLLLANWPAGVYQAAWYRPVDGQIVGETFGSVVNGQLVLPVPDFTEDLVGRIKQVGIGGLPTPIRPVKPPISHPPGHAR